MKQIFCIALLFAFTGCFSDPVMLVEYKENSMTETQMNDWRVIKKNSIESQFKEWMKNSGVVLGCGGHCDEISLRIRIHIDKNGTYRRYEMLESECIDDKLIIAINSSIKKITFPVSLRNCVIEMYVGIGPLPC